MENSMQKVPNWMYNYLIMTDYDDILLNYLDSSVKISQSPKKKVMSKYGLLYKIETKYNSFYTL